MKHLPKSHTVKFLFSLASNVFPQAVRLVSYLVPRSSWYGVALQCSRIQGRLLLQFERDSFDQTLVPHIMDHWLAAFTTRRVSFPIPMRHPGAATLAAAAADAHGLIICSVHLPLFRLIPLALVELGAPPDLLIAGQPEHEGRLNIWGMADGFAAARPTSSVLIKVRTILRNGGSISSLVDYSIGGPYSANIFKLAKHTKSRVIFCLPELREDGVVDMHWIDPPDPFCLSDDGIQRNISVLDSEVRAICRGSNIAFEHSTPEVKRRHQIASQLDTSYVNTKISSKL